MIKVGNTAPNFVLFDSDKQETHLSNLHLDKNLLILFFPQAFTGVCTSELCSVRDQMARYQSLNVNVVGISVDSVFTLAKFKREQGYNFPLLSDFNKEASQSYGVLYETFVFGMKGVSKRSAFVVDKNGVIQYAEVLESAGDVPDFEAIVSVLEDLNAA